MNTFATISLTSKFPCRGARAPSRFTVGASAKCFFPTEKDAIGEGADGNTRGACAPRTTDPAIQIFVSFVLFVVKIPVPLCVLGVRPISRLNPLGPIPNSLISMIISDISNADLGAWVYALATIIQIASTIAILVTINSKQKREITFAGEPVDRKDFDKHVADNAAVHNQLFAKIGGAERGLESRLATRMDRFETESKESRLLMHQDINAIGNDVSALKKEAELANQRSLQMDAKIDRLIERPK